MKMRHVVACSLAIALSGAPVVMSGARQTITVSGTAKKEAKRPYTSYSVRARAVADGSIAASVPLDGSAGFSIPDLQPSTYVLELLNRDAQVVCTEGPLSLMQSTSKVSINCDRDRKPLFLLLAAAAAAGITAGIVTSGDASPSR